jgi:hypothetical protein
MTRTKIGETLGLEAGQVALLMNNRSGSLSVKRLLRFLTELVKGGDTDIMALRTIEDTSDWAGAVAARKEAARRGTKPLSQLQSELAEWLGRALGLPHRGTANKIGGRTVAPGSKQQPKSGLRPRRPAVAAQAGGIRYRDSWPGIR